MARRHSAIALLLLAGCNVGKDYVTPKLDVERSYATSQPTTRPTTRPVVGVNWWKTFDDPILDDLIARATRNNLDMKIAAARVREARAMRQVVASIQYPQIGSSAGYSRTGLSQTADPYAAFNVPGFPWNFDTYSAGFDASWEIDVFGGTRRAIQAADATIQADQDMQRGVLLSVLAEVSRSYVQLRGYQRSLEIARENLAIQEETLQLTQDRHANGTATELDVSRAKAQVAVTRAAIPDILALQWQSIHRISVLLAEDLDPLAKQLTPKKPIPVPPEQVEVGVPAELLRRRPDVREAERQVAAASARVGVATADLYPKFAITGNFGWQTSTPHQMLDNDSMTYGVGPVVSWPVFDGGRIRNIIKGREAQQDQAVAAYEQTVRKAIADVRDALVAFTQEHERRLALAEAQTANLDSVSMAKELYSKGMTDFLTVLEAQRSLYLTQEALLRSETSESTSLIALYKALGGGWEMQFPDAPATQPATQPSRDGKQR